MILRKYAQFYNCLIMILVTFLVANTIACKTLKWWYIIDFGLSIYWQKTNADGIYDAENGSLPYSHI